MKFEALKVGELARRTGLTVRTLHHYDEIGLLKPSLYTEAGYRLYTAANVARLQQVLSLRQLGFSLEEVRDCLDRLGFAPLKVIRLHVARLREQIDLQRKLCERLEALAERFRIAEEVSTDEFLQTIEVMTMIEKYYSPEQQRQIEARKAALGEERIEEANAEWPRLFAAVRTEMDAGTDPADPKVQSLARKWYGLLDEFTGGDPGLFNSTRNMYTRTRTKSARWT
jgi:DNA-binding transcriptional MerR regulator